MTMRPLNLTLMNLSDLDPQSIYLTLAMLALLTGGVLGLMHRGLMADVQPAAVLWRIGTLLLAFAAVFFAFRGELPQTPSVLVGNTLAMLGTALYAHALRRFFGGNTAAWLYGLVALGVVVLALSLTVFPLYRARVIVASGIMATHMIAAAYWVYRDGQRELEISGRMMTGVLLFCGGIVGARAISAPFLPPPTHDNPGLINVLGGMVGAIFPVVCTTAFLMMATERSRIRLLRAAVTDELTGLPNRRALTAEAKRGLAQIQGGTQLGLILLDIDHFKSINDTHGHDIGDKALLHIAGLLRQGVQGIAMAGRFGGEEFLVVLPGANLDTTIAMAESLCAALRATPLNLPDLSLPITASFGVSMVRANDDAIDRALARADAALYRAKSSGRNRVAVQAD
ncbi:GGDEF domain-containing protein [Ahniella affigens]|uniref:diguanylate cyclase n=1 Tax=Ahniella affigens TaxID=2021234 RepID=A0A2P1PY20_9GAMM|nr:GGDEF domain-containing protein [Ahniella affigens]AVP99720.1 GGDEF domain-containing protein [Ahniella affigens]